jgi:hypothetical protein
MMGEADPEALIAERLSGQSPFMTTDLFLDSHELPSAAPDASPQQGSVDTTPASVELPLPESEPSPNGGSHAVDVESGPPAERKSAKKRSKPAHGDRDHFEISAHTIDLESILGELESPPAVAHASSESVEVDLSIVLDDIERPRQESEPPITLSGGGDLDGIFAHLRDGAGRRSPMDEAEQQYKQALALRKAGDIDGCIAALQAASHAPSLRFATALLLARIFRDRGLNSQAVEWFEQAAQVPAPTAAEAHGLLYDLADALEQEGENARALAISLELQADAGDYRDVAVRIERLTKVQARG